MWRRDNAARDAVVMDTAIGGCSLSNPVMTAAGTSGHGAELDAFFPLAELGAVVVKSLLPSPWSGNPAPRLHPLPTGMMNSVGLQGPGIQAWAADELPALEATGATTVASVWGRTVEEYIEAAEIVAALGERIVAVEVNLSCPNLAGKRLFAHDPDASREVVRAFSTRGLRAWAKLSPNTDRVVDVAEACAAAGAEALTLTNTLIGLELDVETRRPVVAGVTGGVSGPGLKPVALRIVWEVSAALPNVPIIGVGGVSTGLDAVEYLLAGASAVQVGTATFADPRAPRRVQRELRTWCAEHGVDRVDELVAGARAG